MLPNSKVCLPIDGLTASNAGTQIVGYVDTLGFDFVKLDVIMTTAAVASNNPSMFKLGDCADTYVTNASDITAFVGDGVGGWTIPDFSVAVGNVVQFNVDCRALERYLHVEVVPITTHTAWAVANLFRGVESWDAVDTSVSASFVAKVDGP